MSFFCYSSGDHRDLPSFPTRRSSDLVASPRQVAAVPRAAPPVPRAARVPAARQPAAQRPVAVPPVAREPRRSEEHTSELQSHVNLVCRLLLEKKNRSSECHLHVTPSQ